MGRSLILLVSLIYGDIEGQKIYVEESDIRRHRKIAIYKPWRQAWKILPL